MAITDLIRCFTAVARAPTPDLAPAALLIARLEYPKLDTSTYMDKLDKLGDAASHRVSALNNSSDPMIRITEVSQYLFKDEGFKGNSGNYDDPRNSFLNEVLERRTGIPITLGLIYIEVARRAGVDVDGINFPGHFLLKVPSHPSASLADDQHVIVDPFHGGAVLSELDCRNLLRKHAGEKAAFDPRLLARATKQEILVRVLVNLKRIYVRMRSFPQARTITDLLLSLNPSATTQLRDRGLLSYHMNDYAAALIDLEEYLRFPVRGEAAGSENDDDDEESGVETEQAEIWEHIKALRRRVASLN